MVNNLIEQIVNIQIRNVISNTVARDLNTVTIFAKHSQFTAPEVYREYTSSSSVANDGFGINSYVYNAARLLFSQARKPTRIIVAVGATTDADYVNIFNSMLRATTTWLWMVSDLRDVDKQVELSGVVETVDKLYLAATHSADAYAQAVTTDLQSRLKALSYENTATWYDVALADEDGDPLPNYTEAALLGRAANGTAGTVNFKLKELVGAPMPSTLDDDNKVIVLTNKGYNFSAEIEETLRSYGSGQMANGEWIKTKLGMLWLKTNIRLEVFTAIADPENLPMEAEGAAVIESRIRSVISRGQTLGIVAKDSPVNVSVPNVLDLPASQRNTGILPDVVFSCRMSGSIQGTVINGEVYV